MWTCAWVLFYDFLCLSQIRAELVVCVASNEIVWVVLCAKKVEGKKNAKLRYNLRRGM